MAVVLTCATFPLISSGGLVTTLRAGMAVPDWPDTFGYNMFLYPLSDWINGSRDVFVEHGHRLMGSLVGMLTIALCLVLWRCERRPWVRWFGVAAVVAVIAQGVLGGTRVLQNDILLARIHGCFGPAFFGLCVAIAVVTSRWWRELGEHGRSHTGSDRLRHVALLATGLAYVQLVIGSFLRHPNVDDPPRVFQLTVVFHLFVAVILMGHIVLITARVLRHRRDVPHLFWPALVLLGLVMLQFALGAGTWVTKYGWPAFVPDYSWAEGYVVSAQGFLRMLIVTGHQATGSLILGVALLISMRTLRTWRFENRQTNLQPAMMGLTG